MDIHKRVEQWQIKEGISFFRNMHLPRKASCFDFGAGYGEYSIALALAYPDCMVYAIDINQKMLKIIKEKALSKNIENIKFYNADVAQLKEVQDSTVDLVLMYDFIHGNDINTKLPLRFSYFKEAHRILRCRGILSIAPFECANLRDITGKRRRYTEEMLIHEIEKHGFQYTERVEGAVHFDYYHSAYHWKKLEGDMPFEYLEQGPALNFMTI